MSPPVPRGGRAYLGLRWEEIAGLKREHLNLLRRELRVVGVVERVAGTYRYIEETKSPASRRTIQLPAFMVDVLSQHLDNAGASEWVFPAPGGGFLRYDNFRRRTWLPAVVRWGLGKITFHELRHTCVAILIDGGANRLEIQRRLGHADIKTTLGVYGHFVSKPGGGAQRGPREGPRGGGARSCRGLHAAWGRRGRFRYRVKRPSHQRKRWWAVLGSNQ
ncbi:MAG: site-specific integrase [Actinomycetota bacterium]